MAIRQMCAICKYFTILTAPFNFFLSNYFIFTLFPLLKLKTAVGNFCSIEMLNLSMQCVLLLFGHLWSNGLLG